MTTDSKKQLKKLNYDPIEALIVQHNKLQTEVDYFEAWREGSIVPLTATGKVRSYNPEAHMAVYDRLIKIGEALLRYGYGRVSEAPKDQQTTVPPLVINLSSSSG